MPSGRTEKDAAGDCQFPRNIRLLCRRGPKTRKIMRAKDKEWRARLDSNQRPSA